jgi:predicted dehydrogenase
VPREALVVRVAFLGVSHWHTAFYTDAVVGLAECSIVGVSDPDQAVVDRYAAALGTDGYVDYRRMCEETRPDLVFALGRHIDMAEAATYLIDAGIPVAMEKPCGVNVAQIEHLAALSERRQAFVAVPFAYRYSRLLELIRERSSGRELVYGMFRQNPGPVSRYWDSGVGWNLDRRLAGGGCTLNLSIHFFDLVQVLAPSATWSVRAATMSSALSGVDVEDFSAALLEADGGQRASVETGYFFPGRVGETVLSVNVGGDYYRWDGVRQEIVFTPEDGAPETFPGTIDQVPFYAAFVADTVTRLAQGRPPAVGLPEMVVAARMAERAYRLAGYDDSMA